VRFTLTAGQKGDAPQAAALIEGLPAEVVMADTAYDADYLRQAIAAKGAFAVIPNNPSRALKYPLDKHLYAQRHLVECCFSKLKQFRRVATRFEKTARNYRAVGDDLASRTLGRYAEIHGNYQVTIPRRGRHGSDGRSLLLSHRGVEADRRGAGFDVPKQLQQSGAAL
jgi:transposase